MRIGRIIRERTGFEVRVIILGHLQRAEIRRRTTGSSPAASATRRRSSPSKAPAERWSAYGTSGSRSARFEKRSRGTSASTTDFYTLAQTLSSL